MFTMIRQLRWMQILGLVPFRIGSQRKICTSVFLTVYVVLLTAFTVAIGSTTTYMYLIKYDLDHLSYSSNFSIEDIGLALQISFGIVLFVVSQFECLLTRKAHIDIYSNLLEADTIFAEFTQSKTNLRTAIDKIVLITQYVLFISLYVAPQIAVWIIATNTINALPLIWRIVLPQLMPTLRYVQLIIYMRMLLTRIDKANAWKPPPTPKYVNLHAFSQLFDRHSATLAAIGDTFGWTILFGMCYDFICIGSWIFIVHFRNPSGEMMAYRSLLVPLGNVLGVTMCGHFAVRGLEKSRTLGLRWENDLTTIGRNGEPTNVVDTFTLKMIHHQPAFNGVGFFAIDMSLVYILVGWISTYLIVCVQFLLEDAQAQNGT